MGNSDCRVVATLTERGAVNRHKTKRTQIEMSRPWDPLGMSGQLRLLVRRAVMRSLCAGAFAVRMATFTDDFGLVGHAFAMGAAVFRFVRGNATASCVSAFLRSAGHNPPPFAVSARGGRTLSTGSSMPDMWQRIAGNRNRRLRYRRTAVSLYPQCIPGKRHPASLPALLERRRFFALLLEFETETAL